MYPAARRDESAVEELQGHRVADPYRWLEGDGEEVRAFVEAQNALSRPILDALPGRPAFVDMLERVLSAPTRGCPFERGGWLFALHNDGDDQPRVVRARSLDALERAETLIDPNTLTDDGTAAVTAFVPNRDASLLAYAISEAGSDWMTIRVRDLATGCDLPTEVRWAKWNHPVWLPGGRAFTYWGYPEPSGNALTQEQGRGALHSLDVDTGEVRTVWVPDDPRTMAIHFADDEWLLIFARRGMDRATQVFARRHDEEELRLVVDGQAPWWPVAVRDQALVCGTVEGAPRGRVMVVPLEGGHARQLVGEHASDVLQDFAATATGYVAHYMADAQSRALLVELDGAPGDPLPVGDGVSIVGLEASVHSEAVYLATTQFCERGDRHLARVDGGALLDWATAPRPDGTVEVPATTRRVRATSNDGVEVPAFVVEPEGRPAGPRPVLLWGYGGFDIALTPEFRAIFAGWVAAGGTLAVANLRGGGEYGEDWHDAGTKARKQQVFDDLYAVAEHLVDTGITTHGQLALHGRSNGGLLAGAALTQRPELWAAVLPGVGVLDMLRYHRFTIGWAWTRDYGDPDEPGVVDYLLPYSPLHNVRPVTYPPTLITTGDHDDRVVPAHSYKFAAELQHTGKGGPILLAVDTRAGHGAGKPKHAQVDEFADQLAFAAQHTGLSPRN